MLNVPQNVQPGNVDRPAVTYDASRNRVVDFGGCVGAMSASCSAWSAQTWTFDGSAWSASSASGPAGRTDATLTFDPATGTSVLFGGENASGPLSDTWSWNGSSWTQLSPPVSPPARYGGVAAYLPSTGLVYVFGGENASGLLSDTWSWNGSTWSELSLSTAPPARVLASLAYAGTLGATANDLLLYGGLGSGGDLSDTWSFNGTGWSEQSVPAGPGPLEQAAMAYDPTLSVPVLYGGNDAGTLGSYLWEWNGNVWLEGFGALSAQISGIGMAQDPTGDPSQSQGGQGQLVVTGGEYATSSQDYSAHTNYETFKIAFLNGHPRSGTVLTRHLDASLTETVSPATTDVFLRQQDFSIPGVGIALNVAQNFDSEGGCVSAYVGCGWTAGLLDVRVYYMADGESVVVELPDGSLNLCVYNGGGSWSCPAGSDLTFTGSAITVNHTGVVYHLGSGNQIASVSDRNGESVTVNYPGGGGQASSIVDTAGRVLTLGYSGGYLASITDPSGRSVAFSYASGQLASITVSGAGAAAVTSFAYLSAGGYRYQVTTPAGRQTVYRLGSVNRVNSVTGVTDPATGAGLTTTLDSYNGDGKVYVTDPAGNTSVYTPTGGQITSVTDPLGDTVSTAYNQASEPTALTNGLAQVTSLTWDPNNNPTSVAAPASSSGQTPATSTGAY